jgi:uncharacterized repeat protein (TIGR03806 family)
VTARAYSHDRAIGPLIRASYEIRGMTPYGLSQRPIIPGPAVPPDPGRLPDRLSQTGLFTSLSETTPREGLVPYGVNSPLWSDGAEKRRWVALPGGETVGFSRTDEWSFPRGTVFVKQFALTTDESDPTAQRRLETRLLVVDGTGGGYGVTYRWRRDGSDADLLKEGASEEITVRTKAGSRAQTWSYPSRDDCLRCHTTIAGFVLGPKTRQLNGPFTYPGTGVTDNQLRTWNYLGMLRPALREEEIPRLDRLAAVGDASASLEDRARSYLDANCMHCHRPGANIPASFDARYDTPPSRGNLLGAATVSDNLGVERPKVVTPGDPAHSLLYLRMVQAERFKMPPLARNEVDRQAATLIKRWIESLAPGR